MLFMPSRLLWLALAFCVSEVRASRAVAIAPVGLELLRGGERAVAERRVTQLQVVQSDGRARADLLLELPLLQAGEILRDIRGVQVDERIVTTLQFGGVVYENEGRAARLNATFLFEGRVGETIFEVEAVTSNPELVVYRALFQVVVGGIQVLFDDVVISGSWRNPVSFGGYQRWIRGWQVAFKVDAQSVAGVGILPVRDRIATSLVEGPAVDSVRTDGCNDGEGVVALGRGADTWFVQGEQNADLAKAEMDDRCGVGLSEDGNWLVLRLVPYRVSGFNFTVRIVWKADEEDTKGVAGRFPTHVDFNLSFDNREVPPPLVLGVVAELDIFGNELLKIGIGNSLSPPRRADLSAQDFSLRMKLANGELQTVNAVAIESYEGGVGTDRQVLFVTPAWNSKGNETITIDVLYDKAADDDENESVRFHLNRPVPTPSKRAGMASYGTAVVAPGSVIDISLADGSLAKLDFCEKDDRIYRDQFVLIRLDVAFYNDSSFSEHKRKQIEQFLRQRFPWLSEDGVRLVNMSTGSVSFAALVPRSVAENVINKDVNDVIETVSNEDLSLAVGLQKNALKKNVELVKISLCEQFPGLRIDQALAGPVAGIGIRFLALWISICILVISLIVVGVILRLRSTRQKSESIDTSSQSGSEFYDPDMATETIDNYPGGIRKSEYVSQIPASKHSVDIDQVLIDLGEGRSHSARNRPSDVHSSTDNEDGISQGLTNSLPGVFCACCGRDGPQGPQLPGPDVYTTMIHTSNSSIADRNSRENSRGSSGRRWRKARNKEPLSRAHVEEVYDPLESPPGYKKANLSDYDVQHSYRKSFVQSPATPAYVGIHSVIMDEQFGALQDVSYHAVTQYRGNASGKEVEEAFVSYLVRAAMELEMEASVQGQDTLKRSNKEEALRAYARHLIRHKNKGNDRREKVRLYSKPHKTVDEVVIDYVQESLHNLHGVHAQASVSKDSNIAERIYELIRATSTDHVSGSSVTDDARVSYQIRRSFEDRSKPEPERLWSDGGRAAENRVDGTRDAGNLSGDWGDRKRDALQREGLEVGERLGNSGDNRDTSSRRGSRHVRIVTDGGGKYYGTNRTLSGANRSHADSRNNSRDLQPGRGYVLPYTGNTPSRRYKAITEKRNVATVTKVSFTNSNTPNSAQSTDGITRTASQRRHKEALAAPKATHTTERSEAPPDTDCEVSSSALTTYERRDHDGMGDVNLITEAQREDANAFDIVEIDSGSDDTTAGSALISEAELTDSIAPSSVSASHDSRSETNAA